MGESQEYWISLMESEGKKLEIVTKSLTTLGMKMKLNNIAITANNKKVGLKWELKKAGIGTESENGDEFNQKSLIQYAFEFDMRREVLGAGFLLMEAEMKYQQIMDEMKSKNAILVNVRIYRKGNYESCFNISKTS